MMDLKVNFSGEQTRASLRDFSLDATGVSVVYARNEWPKSFTTTACPQCGGDVDVKDTRQTDNHGPAMIRRRRACAKCGFTFATMEINTLAFFALVEAHQSNTAVVDALRDLAGQIERGRE